MNEHTRYLDFVKFTDIVSRVDRQMDEHPDLRQQPGKCHLLRIMHEHFLVSNLDDKNRG